VARALAGSRIPTISAVGHETDYTIADFVADLRAPTPSAAAERVVQAKDEITARIDALRTRLGSALVLRMTQTRARLARLTAHRVFEAERGRLRTHAQRVDELVRRSESALRRRLERSRDRLAAANRRTEAFRWERQFEERRARVERLRERLLRQAQAGSQTRRMRLGRLLAQLEGLSPLAVLSRGYALVFDAQGRLVREPGDVAKGDVVRLRVHGGELGAVITEERQ
jgi:exodeoxyribonuclease VII large subunit